MPIFMDINTLTLAELEQQDTYHQHRLNRLQNQQRQRSLKEDKRLELLIGMATLAHLHDLIDDANQYSIDIDKLKAILDRYIHRERDREFLKAFNFL
jgi:hypothetical protein